MKTNDKRQEIAKKVAKTSGWILAKRLIKPIPVVGSVLTIGLVGLDIRKKGLIKGSINSGLDAVPFVGTVKGVVEIFTGDLISDKKPHRRLLKLDATNNNDSIIDKTKS